MRALTRICVRRIVTLFAVTLTVPAWASAVTTDYLSFDGLNDVVTVPSAASLKPTQNITVEAWIRPHTIDADGNQDRILSKGSDFELMISTSDTACSFGTRGHVQWRANIGGTNGRICGGTLSPNSWHHIAGTYDGGRCILYLDGVAVASVARSGALATSTRPLTLGNKAALDRAFDGDLDEVRIWNVARTAMQIQSTRQFELAGTETGLVAYYRLNEGAGPVASDESANNNDGKLGTSSGDDASDPIWVLAGGGNSPPLVAAGPDASIPVAEALALTGAASDDGLPSGTLVTWWSVLSGPGPVTFLNPSVLATTVSFSKTGTYVLQLKANDGEMTASDALKVSVTDSDNDPGVWPTNGWVNATPAEAGMDATLLSQARAYAKTAGGAGFITRGGKLVMSWGDTAKLFDLKSSTKSIGGSILGFALDDNRLSLLDHPQSYMPSFGTPPASNAATGWLDDVTFLQLATHAAGFEKSRGYGSLLYQPGTVWFYSDGGFNWLADTLTVVYGQDLSVLLATRMLNRLGLTGAHLTWRDNLSRSDTINGVKSREFASGIFASVDAMARIGYLYLRRGTWDGQRILSEDFVDQVRQPNAQTVGLPVVAPELATTPAHYGVMWWTNADGALPNVPRDAYWSWGKTDSIILIIPSLDIVATRAGGTGWRTESSHDYAPLAPFFDPIAQSVQH
jgi:CubicO group peptidase (beta-lactamase class C family)